MLIRTTEEYDGQVFTYTYSDAGYMIEQLETGQLYQDALDVLGAGYNYRETDIPADPDASDDDIYAEAGRILLGVE